MNLQTGRCRKSKCRKEELPKITPHVCRHTYCTNMAKTGVSADTLKYFMGYADIATTYNVYNHKKFEDAQREVMEMEEEIRNVE